MSAEFWAALVGAAVGSLLTLLGGWIQQRALETSRRKERIEAEKLSFVREVMRNRFNWSTLASLLNEVPLLFGEDAIAVDLYRRLVNSSDADMRTRSLVDLIVHLAMSVGLSEGVKASDIQRGLISSDA